MANGNIWPSATGGALTSATGQFLQTLITRRELEQRERQLDLAERQVDLSEEAQSFENLMKMVPFLPRGVPISEMPGIHPLIERGLPSVDVNDPLMSQITLNERTISTVLNDLARDRLDELSQTPEGSKVVDRFINQLTAGRGVSTEALEAGETGAILDAEVYSNAWDALKQDPEAFSQAMGIRMGLQQPVTFTDPATGKDWTFDTAQGASLTQDLMKHWSMLEFQWTDIESKEQLDLAKELMNQMEQFDEAIGRPTALQIIRAWNNQMQAVQKGDVEEGQGPWYDLYQSYQDSGNTGALRAMQVWGGSATFAEQSIEDMVTATPAGFQAAYAGYVGKLARDIFGVEDKNLITKFMRNIFEANPEFGVEMVNPWFGGPQVRFNTPSILFPGMTPMQTSPGGGTPFEGILPPVPDAARVPAGGAGGVPGTGLPTTEQAISQAATKLFQDIERYRTGEMTLDELRGQYPDPKDVRFIIRMARGGR